MRIAVFTALVLALPLAACKKDEKKNKTTKTTTDTPNKPPPKKIEFPAPLDTKEAPADAVAANDSTKYKILQEGSGDAVGKNDIVKIHYVWWRPDGRMVTTSRRSKMPHPKKLGMEAPGWRAAIAGMKKGEKRMVWLPAKDLRRSPRRRLSKDQSAALEIELVEFEPAKPAPPTLTKPADDAKTLKSGVAVKVLKPGTGKDKPRYFDQVQLKGFAWDKDGVQFWQNPKAVSVPLIYQSAALKQAVQQVGVGETALVWIPESMNEGDGQFPAGPLVFELTVESIKKGNTPPDAPADVAKPPANAKQTKGGVFYKVLKKGKGKTKPTVNDSVEVHYSGWTTDGKLFDSSRIQDKTITFGLRKVIPGWTDGLQVMSEGDRVRFWIPEKLAYRGMPGRPKGMLVFDVDLIKVIARPKPTPPQPPPPTPKDVAKPPKDAKKTQAGVFYKVLKKGNGKTNPTPTSSVTVHYSGWTTDGKMFDSSVTRGKPATFRLNGVIKGWTDGLQVMVEGDKTRFWIPKEMAYDKQPGRPQGMLVFDVELLKIQ